MNELYAIAEYFYFTKYEYIRKDSFDSPNQISFRKSSDDMLFLTKSIESPEISQMVQKFLSTNNRTWYDGFSLIEKDKNCVIFQKWATMDAGIYVVYSPWGKENVYECFSLYEILEVAPIGVDNWYYCYAGY